MGACDFECEYGENDKVENAERVENCLHGLWSIREDPIVEATDQFDRTRQKNFSTISARKILTDRPVGSEEAEVALCPPPCSAVTNGGNPPTFPAA